MKILCTILLLSLIVTTPLYAQHRGSAKNQAAIGIGLGLPYGGTGAKLSYNPADQFTLFGGLGYNFLNVGVNGGFLYSFPSTTQTELYVTGMYGYNAVMNIEGFSKYQKSYGGPSFGFGAKINSLRKEGAYWDISLLVPVRSQAFKDSWDEVKRNPSIEVTTDPWPLLFSFGYNFPLTSR
jgi:hypothetical protein